MNLYLVSMSHVFFRAIRAVFSSKAGRLSLPCLVLAGCVSHAPQSAISGKQEDKWPDNQLADFLSTRCEDIWNLSGHDVENNPLFWLRGIDCAQRLAPVDARMKAAMLDEDTAGRFQAWDFTGRCENYPVERRANVTRLDTFVINLPAQVRPVYQLWRDGQTLQLQLSEERSRYSKLQQSTDSELDTLRQQQQHLRTQLDTTTRKLENLTDIERQLSSRKYQLGSSSAAPDSDMPKQEDVKHDEP